MSRFAGHVFVDGDPDRHDHSELCICRPHWESQRIAKVRHWALIRNVLPPRSTIQGSSAPMNLSDGDDKTMVPLNEQFANKNRGFTGWAWLNVS